MGWPANSRPEESSRSQLSISNSAYTTALLRRRIGIAAVTDLGFSHHPSASGLRMALSSSSCALRRLLRTAASSSSSSSSSLPRWSPLPFAVYRHNFSSSSSTSQSPSIFPFDDDNSAPLPPLTTPKLFVSGLSRLTTDDKLREAFSPYGHLLEAKVIADRISGRSKGFGFVRYATIEEADKARHGMNAKFLDGWVIFVDPAKPREPKPTTSSAQQPSEDGIRTNKTIGWCG